MLNLFASFPSFLKFHTSHTSDSIRRGCLGYPEKPQSQKQASFLRAGLQAHGASLHSPKGSNDFIIVELEKQNEEGRDEG